MRWKGGRLSKNVIDKRHVVVSARDIEIDRLKKELREGSKRIDEMKKKQDDNAKIKRRD